VAAAQRFYWNAYGKFEGGHISTYELFGSNTDWSRIAERLVDSHDRLRGDFFFVDGKNISGDDIENVLVGLLEYLKKEILKIAEKYAVEKGIDPKDVYHKAEPIERAKIKLKFILEEFLGQEAGVAAKEFDLVIKATIAVADLERNIKGWQQDLADLDQQIALRDRRVNRGEIIGKVTETLAKRFGTSATSRAG